MTEMRNFLQNLKGSTEKIMQQQIKTHHHIKPLQYHNWGNTAFRTQNQNQTQNHNFLGTTTTAQYSAQNICTNQSVQSYQENQMQQQIQQPPIQTATLTSPTSISGSKSLPTTPRNSHTPTRFEQPQTSQENSLFLEPQLFYSQAMSETQQNQKTPQRQ